MVKDDKNPVYAGCPGISHHFKTPDCQNAVNKGILSMRGSELGICGFILIIVVATTNSAILHKNGGFK
jgi:hypothetical protein